MDRILSVINLAERRLGLSGVSAKKRDGVASSLEGTPESWVGNAKVPSSVVGSPPKASYTDAVRSLALLSDEITEEFLLRIG
jgi:hypothetical protein